MRSAAPAWPSPHSASAAAAWPTPVAITPCVPCWTAPGRAGCATSTRPPCMPPATASAGSASGCAAVPAASTCCPPSSGASSAGMARSAYDYTAAGVERTLAGSLDRLGLGRVDIVFIHDLTPALHGDRVRAAVRDLHGWCPTRSWTRCALAARSRRWASPWPMPIPRCGSPAPGGSTASCSRAATR